MPYPKCPDEVSRRQTLAEKLRQAFEPYGESHVIERVGLFPEI